MVLYLKGKIPSGTSLLINGFYGGPSEPKQFPKATVEQEVISVSLGNKHRIIRLKDDLRGKENSSNTKEVKRKNSLGRILRKLKGAQGRIKEYQ